MKIIGLLLTSILFHSLCIGQDDAKAVPFVAYWSIGDSYDFKVTKIKQKWRDEEQTKNDTSSYIANFLVLDSTATSYKIKWSFKTVLSEFNIPEKHRESFNKYRLTEAIYTTTELGEFTGIENWEEISEMMKSILNDVVEASSKENPDSKGKLTKAIKPIIDAYSSEQGVEQLLFKELQYIHFPYGLEYSTTEKIEYEDQLPNAFGGRPTRADAQIYIDEVDFDESYCVMIHKMKLNPDDTREVLNKVFKKMGLKDKDLKEAVKAAIFEIQDFNEFEFYYYPGVPIRISTKRETVIEFSNIEGKSNEQVIIELMD